MAEESAGPKQIVINVKMQPDEKQMMQKMAIDDGRTMSEIIRSLIRSRFRWRYAAEQQCISGKPCLCPTMHQYQNPDAPSNADLLAQETTPNAAA